MRVSIFNEDIACEYVDRQVLTSKDIGLIFGCSTTAASRYLKKAREHKEKLGIETYHKYIVPANVAFEAWGFDVDMLRKQKKKKEKAALKERIRDEA